MHNAVSFELSLTIHVDERQVFGLLDILSAVGDLYGAVKIVVQYVMGQQWYRLSRLQLVEFRPRKGHVKDIPKSLPKP